MFLILDISFKVNLCKQIYSSFVEYKTNIIWTGQDFEHYRKVFIIASELDLNFFVSISNNVSTMSEWFWRDANWSGLNPPRLGALGFST